jgi:hypothetical protein
VRVEKVSESKPTDDASKESSAVRTVDETLLRDELGEALQIGPAAAGAKAARAQLRLSCGTCEKLIGDV